MISTTILVTFALCLTPFDLGGKRNVIPMRSLGSKIGIGLDPDGLSSALDLMKTVRVFFSEEPSEDIPGYPSVVWASEEPVDEETSSPCGSSLWLGVEDFWGLTAQL